jgi:hypothetical protein
VVAAQTRPLAAVAERAVAALVLLLRVPVPPAAGFRSVNLLMVAADAAAVVVADAAAVAAARARRLASIARRSARWSAQAQPSRRLGRRSRSRCYHFLKFGNYLGRRERLKKRNDDFPPFWQFPSFQRFPPF